MGQDNAHPGGGRRRKKCQLGGVWGWDKTTHTLGVERGEKSVSWVDFGDGTRQHTNWQWNKAKRVSARWILVKSSNNIHPEMGIKWKHQVTFIRQYNIHSNILVL